MKNTNSKNKIIAITEAFILMIALQGIMEFFEWLIALNFPDTRFSRNMVTM
jgi:hypothetical protein